MFLSPYPERNSDQGMKVWLEQHELDRWVGEAANTQQKIAFLLLGYSGLRVAEVLEVCPQDVVNTSAGPRVRVWSGKGDKHRESIASNELLTLVDTIVDVSDIAKDEPIIETEHTRTVRRWVYRSAEKLAEKSGEKTWEYLSPHDLRGTWVTLMMHDYKVDPLMCCDWGGWDNIETLLNHYRGTYSVSVQRRELENVPWIAIDSEESASYSDDPEEIGRIREFSKVPA